MMMEEASGTKGTEMQKLNNTDTRSDSTAETVNTGEQKSLTLRKIKIFSYLVYSKVRSFVSARWAARYNTIAKLPFEESTDGINTVALVNALILTIPYGIMSYICGDFFDTLERDMTEYCKDGLLNGEDFNYYFHSVINNIATCVYAPMITLSLVAIYYLLKDPNSDEKKNEKEDTKEKEAKRKEMKKKEQEEIKEIWTRIDKNEKAKRNKEYSQNEKILEDDKKKWDNIDKARNSMLQSDKAKDESPSDEDSKNKVEKLKMKRKKEEEKSLEDINKREKRWEKLIIIEQQEEEETVKLIEKKAIKHEQELELGNKLCEECGEYRNKVIYFQKMRRVKDNSNNSNKYKDIVEKHFDTCKRCRLSAASRMAKGKLFMLMLFTFSVVSIVTLMNVTSYILELWMPYNICVDNDFTNGVWRTGVFFTLLSLPIGFWLSIGSNKKVRKEDNEIDDLNGDDEDDETTQNANEDVILNDEK